MKDIAATPTMSEQKGLDQRLDVIPSESAQGHGDDGVPHDSDNEPMVYETPRDYATYARQERDRLIAEGADPDSVIFSSELDIVFYDEKASPLPTLRSVTARL
jgi:hypothetical protein